MAVEKKALAKADKAKAAKKEKRQPFRGLKRLGKYFKDVGAEVKKITWPTKKDYLTHVVVVAVFLLVMTFIIFTMNALLTGGLDLLLNIGA